MKNIQFKFSLLLLLLSSMSIYSQRTFANLNFNPSALGVTVNSGNSVTVASSLFSTPAVNCWFNYSIIPVAYDSGLEYFSPGGTISPFGASTAFFSFNKDVTQTETVIYQFIANWSTFGCDDFSSGVSYITIYVTYKYVCNSNLNITQNVTSGQIDIKESSSTITASNTIFSGGTAEYDTGNTLFLKPNFNAKHGSTFRAYIQGCNATKPIIVAEIKKNNTVEVEVEPIDKSKNIKVYPNPTNNFLTIESSEKIISWELLDAYSKTHFKGNESKTKLNMSRLPKGIYILKAILKDGSIVTKKVIKN